MESELAVERSLEDELADFLVRLGLTIEERADGLIRATRRTALRQETSAFLIGPRPGRRRRRGILVLPNDSDPPARHPGKWLYFDDLLDRTIQSDRIAEEASTLDFDPGVREQLQVFVAQRIAEGGSPIPRDAVDYVFHEWLSDPDSRLLVTLGPAGYGKTLLSYELARRLGEAHISSQQGRRPPRQPVPFLVPFGHFRRVAEFEAMILTSLQRRGITDFTAAAFAYLVARKRVVLFLDGFDELLEERPAEAQRNLREFIETVKGEGKVLITARSTFFRTSLDVADFLEHDLASDEVKVIDLQPFDASQRRVVVQRLSPDQRTINRVAQIVEAPQIREAMGSPLLLRETVEALVDGGVELKGSLSRRLLFASLEKSIYDRERRRHAHLLNDQVQRDMLKTLGGESLRENVRGFDMDSVRVAAAEAIGDRDASEADLEKLADHHFLTVDHESQDVRFNHQVFREYFQALSLVDALEQGDQAWVVTILGRRPLPEEVAEFIAELGDGSIAQLLIDCMSGSGSSSQLLVNNIGAVCLAFEERDIFTRFIAGTDPRSPLTLRIRNFDGQGFDFSNRMFESVDFLGCSLQGADFSGTIMSNVGFYDCNLDQARFEGTEFHSATFDYRTRLFGTAPILRALAERGAFCGPDFEDQIESLTQTYRESVVDIVKGRFRRFYVPGRTGPEGSRWDTSIKERTLLSGLDQSTRAFVAGYVIPEMTRLQILSRHREHGEAIFRLEDTGKDDARALLERGEEAGVVRELVGRLVHGDAR